MRDLLDAERVKLEMAMSYLEGIAISTPNTSAGLKEFGARAQDLFFRLGFIANIDLSICGLIDPKTGRSFSPQIEIIGLVDDLDDISELDHDEKRFEVLDAKEKGEKFRGEKYRVDLPRKK